MSKIIKVKKPVKMLKTHEALSAILHKGKAPSKSVTKGIIKALQKPQTTGSFLSHVVLVGVVLAALILLIIPAVSHASTTSCNMYGNTQVCNTYNIDGTMEQETTNQYGNTLDRKYSRSPYNDDYNENN